MTTARIKCFTCENTFEYYFHLSGSSRDIKCPFCRSEMDRQTAEKVITAIGVHEDTNRELCRDSKSGHGTPLFQFDLVTRDLGGKV